MTTDKRIRHRSKLYGWKRREAWSSFLDYRMRQFYGSMESCEILREHPYDPKATVEGNAEWKALKKAERDRAMWNARMAVPI